MKINLAKSAGFCFGVKRAIEIAYQAAKTDKHIYMLGDIVHNEDVIKQIEKLGIKKISKLSNGKDKALIIRAHGAGTEIYNKAAELGYKIIDATCPMVKHIHKIAKEMESKRFKIIIIGDKKHDEVKGIIGQLENKAIIIDSAESFNLNIIKHLNKAAILCQSTQNIEKVVGILNRIKPYINELKFFNTICQPTITKQSEIKTLPLNNDVVLVIGGRTSANTGRLYEISKKLNPRTYWIRKKEDIKPLWFKNVKSVGITAGASTPAWITQEVISYLKKLY